MSFLLACPCPISVHHLLGVIEIGQDDHVELGLIAHGHDKLCDFGVFGDGQDGHADGCELGAIVGPSADWQMKGDVFCLGVARVAEMEHCSRAGVLLIVDRTVCGYEESVVRKDREQLSLEHLLVALNLVLRAVACFSDEKRLSKLVSADDGAVAVLEAFQTISDRFLVIPRFAIFVFGHGCGCGRVLVLKLDVSVVVKVFFRDALVERFLVIACRVVEPLELPGESESAGLMVLCSFLSWSGLLACGARC